MLTLTSQTRTLTDDGEASLSSTPLPSVLSRTVSGSSLEYLFMREVIKLVRVQAGCRHYLLLNRDVVDVVVLSLPWCCHCRYALPSPVSPHHRGTHIDLIPRGTQCPNIDRGCFLRQHHV
jgi:hypothetical protein